MTLGEGRSQPIGAAESRWLEKVVEQLRAVDGVACEAQADGGIALTLSYNGASRDVALDLSETDYRDQKVQFNRIREALAALGIVEGQEFTAAKRPRRPMSPEILAAREKQKKVFEAWQEVWRTLRQAEHGLDVEYEIAQMQDYY